VGTHEQKLDKVSYLGYNISMLVIRLQHWFLLFILCFQPTELFHQAMVLFTTEEMQMQVKKTGLFEDIDFHNEKVMQEFNDYITDPVITLITHHEILCAIADIVAKRKQPESGMLDLHTGLRY
jgi:hypothetical protein